MNATAIVVTVSVGALAVICAAIGRALVVRRARKRQAKSVKYFQERPPWV